MKSNEEEKSYFFVTKSSVDRLLVLQKSQLGKSNKMPEIHTYIGKLQNIYILNLKDLFSNFDNISIKHNISLFVLILLLIWSAYGLASRRLLSMFYKFSI